MVGFELRKLLQKASTRVLLVALFAVNLVTVWTIDAPGTGYGFGTGEIRTIYSALPEDGALAVAALEDQCSRLEAALWEEEFDGQLLTGDVYSELGLFRAVAQRVEPAAEYGAYLAQVEANAQALLASGLFRDPAGFGFRNLLLSRQKFLALSAVEPEIFYSGAVELLPNQRVTDGLMVLLCLLLGLELMTGERVSGTLALVKPAKKGRVPLLGAKLGACAVALLVGVTALYGSNLAVGVIRCGGFPLSAPLQSLYGFQGSPWKISVGAYLALFFCLKYLWSVSLGSVIVLMCLIADSSAAACGLSIGALLPSLFLARNTDVLGCFSLVNTGDTVAQISVYRNLNVLGTPVSAFALGLTAMTVTIAACTAACFLLHQRRSPLPKAPRRKPRSHRLPISVSLLVHESYKLLVMNGGLWALAALIAVQAVSYHDFSASIGPEEETYIQYSAILSGPPDGEKEAYLAQEAAHFAGLQERLEEYGQAYAAGKLDQDTYELLCSGTQRQLAGQTAFDRANSQYVWAKARNVDYVCLTGYARLLGPEGKRDLLIQTVKLFSALILGLAACFCVETETGMTLLLHTAVLRRRSETVKRFLGILYAALAAAISYLPQAIAVGLIYGLPNGDAPAASVPYLGIPFASVRTAFCIYGIGAVLLSTVAAMVILLLSQRTKNTVQTILFSGLLLELPPAAAFLCVSVM